MFLQRMHPILWYMLKISPVKRYATLASCIMLLISCWWFFIYRPLHHAYFRVHAQHQMQRQLEQACKQLHDELAGMQFQVKNCQDRLAAASKKTVQEGVQDLLLLSKQAQLSIQQVFPGNVQDTNIINLEAQGSFDQILQFLQSLSTQDEIQITPLQIALEPVQEGLLQIKMRLQYGVPT